MSIRLSIRIYRAGLPLEFIKNTGELHCLVSWNYCGLAIFLYTNVLVMTGCKEFFLDLFLLVDFFFRKYAYVKLPNQLWLFPHFNCILYILLLLFHAILSVLLRFLVAKVPFGWWIFKKSISSIFFTFFSFLAEYFLEEHQQKTGTVKTWCAQPLIRLAFYARNVCQLNNPLHCKVYSSCFFIFWQLMIYIEWRLKRPQRGAHFVLTN